MNLAAELPALVSALEVRLGPVSRVAFNLAAWNTAPRKLIVDDRVVRLQGFRTQDPHTILVTGPNWHGMSLLVVPPEADDASAHMALALVAGRENTGSSRDILASSGVVHADPIAEIPTPRAGILIRSNGGKPRVDVFSRWAKALAHP